MADSSKGLEISLKVNTEDARKLDEVLLRLSKSADLLTIKFTAMNAAMTGLSGGSMTTSTGAPKAGVPSGMAGSAGKESPLLAQFRAVDQFLKTTYLTTLQRVTEAQRGILVGGPRSSYDSSRAVTEPHLRPLSDPSVATRATAGVGKLGDIDVNSVIINAQTVTINADTVNGGAGGAGDGGAGEADGGAGGGGKRKGTAGSKKGILGRAYSFLPVINAGLHATAAIAEGYQYSVMAPESFKVQAKVQEAEALSAVMSGNLSRAMTIKQMGGLGAVEQDYGLSTSTYIERGSRLGSAAIKTATAGVALIGAGALGAKIGAFAGGALGIETGPGALLTSAAGAAIGAGIGNLIAEQFGGGVRGVMKEYTDLGDDAINAAVQGNMNKVIQARMAQNPIQQAAESLRAQRQVGTLTAQRMLAPVGGNAYDQVLAGSLDANISQEQALSISERVTRMFSTPTPEELRKKVGYYGQLIGGGYEKELSDIMTLHAQTGLDNVFAPMRRGYQPATGTYDVQFERMMLPYAAQYSMTNFGKMSETGLENLSVMMGAGAPTPVEFQMRRKGVDEAQSAGQDPLVQMVTMARIQKEHPELLPFQIRNLANMSPQDLIDPNKVATFAGVDQRTALSIGKSILGTKIEVPAAYSIEKSFRLSSGKSLGDVGGLSKGLQTGEIGGADISQIAQRLMGTSKYFQGFEPTKELLKSMAGLSSTGAIPSGRATAGMKEAADPSVAQAVLSARAAEVGLIGIAQDSMNQLSAELSATASVVSQIASQMATRASTGGAMSRSGVVEKLLQTYGLTKP